MDNYVEIYGSGPCNPSKCQEPMYIHFGGEFYCKKHFSDRFIRLMSEKNGLVLHHKYLDEETRLMTEAERKLLQPFKEMLICQSSHDIVRAFEQIDRELKEHLPDYSLLGRMRQIFISFEEQQKANAASAHPDEFGGSDY